MEEDTFLLCCSLPVFSGRWPSLPFFYWEVTKHVLLGFSLCSQHPRSLVAKHDYRWLSLSPWASRHLLHHGTASERTDASPDGPRRGVGAQGALRGHWGNPLSLRRPVQLGHWLPPWGLQAPLQRAWGYNPPVAQSIWRGKSLHPTQELNATDTPSKIASWSHAQPATTLQSHSGLKHQQPGCFGTKLLVSRIIHHISHLTHVKQTPCTGMRQGSRNNLTIQWILYLKSSNKASNTQDGSKVLIHLLKSLLLQSQL